MTLGPYASFIVGSYALVTAVVVALIVWVIVDYRRQQKNLRDLEAAGATRRSAQKPTPNIKPGVMNASGTPGVKRRSWLVALPLVVFAALAALLAFRLGSGDPSKIPSALIGRAAPSTPLPPLEGLTAGGDQVPGLDPAAFKGQVSLVNVWASWCVPCHDEAPLLIRLAADKRIRMVGINYKDSPDNARRFLGRHGNPFAAVGVDGNGRGSIDWGVYGVPETFVVGRDGAIAYKLVGPITPDNIEAALKPAIDKALRASK